MMFSGLKKMELRACPAADIKDGKKIVFIDNTRDLTFKTDNEWFDQPIVEPPG
jgi:hypothetical protein